MQSLVFFNRRRKHEENVSHKCDECEYIANDASTLRKHRRTKDCCHLNKAIPPPLTSQAMSYCIIKLQLIFYTDTYLLMICPMLGGNIKEQSPLTNLGFSENAVRIMHLYA